ncbi:hypothetical protein [uncultured Sulfitobacter sp.]|uniref:hypothetical protein n=1 Tax=uncultured Sulfitobacter sp. TaxID=191468 RepID=UPI002636F6D4|nr:hypothetical protein [uncultured Sulfitobacter sp.]
MKLRKIGVPMSGRYDPHDPGNLDGPVFGVALSYAEAFRALVEVLCVTEPAAPGLSAWTAFGAMAWKFCLRRCNSLETGITHTQATFGRVTNRSAEDIGHQYHLAMEKFRRLRARSGGGIASDGASEGRDHHHR